MEKSYNKLEDACQLIEKEWFDRFFIDYFSKDGAAYKHYIRVKRYKLTDNNVSSRVLNHWVNKGIFHDDRKDKKGWKIFSITDTVLLTIIKRLRLFGLDLDRIKKVTDYLYSYNYLDKEANCLLLDFYISLGTNYLNIDPINLIVDGEGDAVLVRQSTLNQLLQMGTLMDYIVIDLKALLEKGAPNEYHNISKYVPSELEKEIQETVNTSNLISLNIKVNDKEYHLSKKRILQDKKSAEGLMNILKYATYEEIKTGEKSKHIIKEHKKIKKE